MEIAIGIDVHKVNCAVYAVFAGKNEPTPKQERFLEKFNEKYRRVPSDMVGMTDIAKAVSGHAVHVLIENSTKSHDIYRMLKNLGIDVTVAHATDLYNRVGGGVSPPSSPATERTVRYSAAPRHSPTPSPENTYPSIRGVPCPGPVS